VPISKPFSLVAVNATGIELPWTVPTKASKNMLEIIILAKVFKIKLLRMNGVPAIFFSHS